MSEDENRVRATGEVVAAMIEAVREGKVINLNAVKNAAARKHGLKRNLKLVELIQAVPDEHRGALLPQLRAKPVRTASGSKLGSQLWLTKRAALPGGARARRDKMGTKCACVCA